MILALEATDQGGSVALADRERLLSVQYLESKKTHSERLMPIIEDILNEHGRAYDDIELFSCARGPGSFTAIRLAVTTAKTLAMVNDTPLVSVSSLRLMAEWVYPVSVPVRVLLDARRGQFYHQLFQSENDRLQPDSEPELIGPEKLQDRIPDREEVVVARQRDQSLDPDRWPGGWSWYPSAQARPLSLSLIGMIHRGVPSAEPIGADEARPMYVRPSDAQRSRERDEVTV